MHPQMCDRQHSRKVNGQWVRGDNEEPGEVICANGVTQVKMRCGYCGAKSGALPYKVIHAWGLVQADCTWRVEHEPYEHQPCIVLNCGLKPTEQHHFAPRNTFGADADLWPVLPLCVAHHREWHQRMDGYRWHRKGIAA